MRIVNVRRGSVAATRDPLGLTNAYLIYAAPPQAALSPTGPTSSPEILGLSAVGLSQSPFPLHYPFISKPFPKASPFSGAIAKKGRVRLRNLVARVRMHASRTRAPQQRSFIDQLDYQRSTPLSQNDSTWCSHIVRPSKITIPLCQPRGL